MSSLNAILNTAANAISAYQSAISVTSQNIANADNDDYSIQTAVLSTTSTVSSGGNIYGTGVTVETVESSVNQTIENALTSELSTQAALEEEEVYMATIEDLFSEDSDDSLNTLLDAYWSAWEDLSNNPSGETEQNAVYDAGVALADRINAIEEDLTELTANLNTEISSAVSEVNSIAEQIAALNLSIINAESTGGNANDLEDERNALVDDLGELIDIDITVKEDGTYLITTSGLPLVEDGIAYDLSVKQGSVYWNGKSGNAYDITDDISGGAIAGWLEVRDVIIPETMAEFDELASNLIWTLNYVHSQGAGQTYFSGSLEGTYEAGDSGTLASLYYGDDIDYSKDFSMVIQDASGTDSEYQTVTVDMAISTSEISNISGTGEKSSTYEITVIDEGTLGEQILVQSGATNLGSITTSASDIADALDAALSEQTLTISNGNDTWTLDIGDDGSDAVRSAADIADELSDIDGITAYASTTQLNFDISNISDADDGDVVQFTLYVDGVEETVSFTVDSSAGTLEEQFEDALAAAAQSINETRQDTDLAVDGTTIESASGATLGIQDFEVADTASYQLSSFQNFNQGDTVGFSLMVTVDGVDTYIDVEVDLTDVDTSDQAAVSLAFYDAMSAAVEEEGNGLLSVEYDADNDAVILHGTTSNYMSILDADADSGDDATIAVTPLSGSQTDSGDGILTFGTPYDSEVIYSAPVSTDYLTVYLSGCETSSQTGVSAIVGDAYSGYDTAAVITGSVTIVMDPGMEISSDQTSDTGLFGASGSSGSGSSMITLGFDGDDNQFYTGSVISFDVDDYTISYTVTNGLDDASNAQDLYDALSAVLPSESYEIIKNGTSITIVKTGDDAVEITDFSSTLGNSTLSVTTGTGSGSETPENDTLVANSDTKNSTTAVTYGDAAILYWEVLDEAGNSTGTSGYIEVDQSGVVEITEDGETTLSFDISEGSLVAGNTLRINTDEDGQADLLDVYVTGTAASVDDTYEFTVVSGGTLPDNEDVIVIEWTSETGSGAIELEGTEDENSQITVAVDGMTLTFDSGTLVEGDVFYITTDENGDAVTDVDGNTVETLSDWHWTLESFAEEFNRSAGGVTTSVTGDNTLVFQTSDDYCAIENVSCSGADNIDEENFEITVLNYNALTIEAEDLQFVRSNGTWYVANDPTGGTITIIPEGGDDDGFEIDLDGDGIGDIEIIFDKAVTGDGYIRIDFESKDADDLSYAFAGDVDGDCGLAAALGVNTFFTGTDAATISVNEVVSDGDYLASGMVDTETGALAASDNTNALAMSDTRYTTLDMKAYTYTRGEGVSVTVTQTTLDDYQASLVSSVGSAASSISSALEYAETLVYQLTSQRDSISAVSLDEEMINLTAQQQAYLAAAQLLTTVEEMFEALLAIR